MTTSTQNTNNNNLHYSIFGSADATHEILKASGWQQTGDYTLNSIEQICAKLDWADASTYAGIEEWHAKMSKLNQPKKFTQAVKKAAQRELTTAIADAVDKIYLDRIVNLNAVVEAQLALSQKKAQECYFELPEELRFDAQKPYTRLIQGVVEAFPKNTPLFDLRPTAYSYIHHTRRTILLRSLTTSKTKLRSVAKDTLTGLIKAELSVKKGNKVTLSQVINSCTLRPAAVIKKNGTSIDLDINDNEDAFITEELKLQFVSELCELDLVDMRVSDHTHMVEVPKIISKLLPEKSWNRMYELSRLVSRKTIYTEIPNIDTKNMISRSSWYYRTPELSQAQIDQVAQMNSIKYEFVDNALELVEEAYMEHLKADDGTLPQGHEYWVPERIEFFKEQITESQLNGGHYVETKWDSSLRLYMQAEIGHFQTSKSLRSLVKVADMNDPIKKDFKNNVIQIYTLLTGTRDSAKYVGMLPDYELEADLRLQIAQRLNSKLDVTVFTKDNIKPLFMIWAYNAGKKRLLEGTVKVEKDWYTGEDVTETKTPGLLKLCGAKDTEANRDIIWNAFEETVTELVPVVVALKAIFKKLIKNNPLMETSWTTPDGSIAQYASPKTEEAILYWVDSRGKQHQHTHHKKLLVENAKASGLLPRVIHSFDAWIARQLVIRASRLGITIIPNHDSFMFDRQYENIVDQIIEDLFIELLESDYLRDVVEELNTSNKPMAVYDEKGEAITMPYLQNKLGTLTVEDLTGSQPTDYEEI